MKTDRKLQRKMLEEMRDAYPEPVNLFEFGIDLDAHKVANLRYIEEHGLCEAELQMGIDHYWSAGDQKITVRGIDFLEDDGGLGAILGVVTVKLHADTIRGLLESKVEQQALPEEEKRSLKHRIAKLPAAVLAKIADNLIQRGLEQMPNALHWLQTNL